MDIAKLLSTDGCVVEICRGSNQPEDFCPRNPQYVKIPLNASEQLFMQYAKPNH